METKSYNFSSIRFSDLEQIVLIKSKVNDAKFEEWFGFSYEVSSSDMEFLQHLITKHRRRLPAYMEEDLKMKFLSPILNRVDFINDNFQDWYEPYFEGTVNGISFKGFTDYMVATGEKEPKKPYFFIQEFKPTQADKDVEDQLLAEMLVAVEKNQQIIFRGAYIIGQFWKFVILEKIGENNFEYFVSEAFDALKIKDLKQIYINLQAVKHLYCVD